MSTGRIGVPSDAALVLANVSDVTASAAEINILDGVVGVSAAELSYVANVTSDIQTQLDAVADGVLTFVVGDGASVVATGFHGFLVVPFSCTIASYTLISDASGSIVFDIWKDTYANAPPTVADTITAAAKPTLSGAQKSTNSTLTGWTTSITAGDVLGINVDSSATVKRVTMALKVGR